MMQREAESLRRELGRVGARRGPCFSEDLKRRATAWIVKRRAAGVTVTAVASELGLSPGTVLNWSARAKSVRALVPVEVVADPGSPSDTDGTGAIDALDDDSDDDGITDDLEAGDADWTTAAANTDGQDLPDFQDTDSDNDGDLDAVDNCRIVANPDQANGDNDAFGDACVGDIDGDGVSDGSDNCTSIPLRPSRSYTRAWSASTRASSSGTSARRQ